jgi:hypothetical protein
MPRKRKAAREYIDPGGVRSQIRQRFKNPFALCGIAAENFFTTLPTAAERAAFAEEFPVEFFDLFDFYRHGLEDCAAAIDYDFAVFRRWDFEAFLAAHPPRVAFKAPDLREVPFPDRHRTVALARAHWWLACALAVDKAEIAWLGEYAPDLLPVAKQCPQDDGRWDRKHKPREMVLR